MAKVYVLYNPLAGNLTCEKSAEDIKKLVESEELIYTNFCELDNDLDGFFKGLEADDKVILCGGDGTINFFVNHIRLDNIKNEILYYPAGSGNDFYHDVEDNHPEKIIPLNKYLTNLPTVEVRGNTRKFINGIGYGIDGYCCEEGDKTRTVNPGKPVNYTLIALKGLLYGYKKVNAVVTVDGVSTEYTNVWMTPTMNGRYFGGGMMCAPNQDRLNEDKQVSVIVVHTGSRIRLLTAFSTIFKGTHLKYTTFVKEIKGSKVHVKFDRPTALQIDGETISNVMEYTVTK